MEWGGLIGPAVVAAIVSGFISTIALVVNRATTVKLHSEKIGADHRLAERKVDADIALARQKFEYDRHQAIFKRRFELAEQALADAYQFRSVMRYVRNGVTFEGEGESRRPETYEAESIKRSRNNYFVPLERLRTQDEFLASMFARRTVCEAHFGEEAETAFIRFNEALHRVRVAASLLIEWTNDQEVADRDTMKKLRHDLWQPMAKHSGQDEIGDKVDEGVLIIEKVCRPVLAWVGSP